MLQLVTAVAALAGRPPRWRWRVREGRAVSGIDIGKAGMVATIRMPGSAVKATARAR